MTIPTPSFGPDGFVTPSEPEILIAVKEEINQAFGGNLNMADETPQGQIAVSQAAAIGNSNDAFIFLTQQFDPAYNIGRYQDAIARIYFIERFPARPTFVLVTCTGGVGVVIPANAIVMADDGTQYLATDGGVIPPSGSINLNFECAVPGPIPCAAGSINTIYQAVPGWDQVSNPDDGVLGRNTETRDEFEERRALSVAHNSIGSLPSIVGAVLTTDDVLDAYVTENTTDTIQVIGGVTLFAHSLYVAAVGGDDEAVARAIWSKKAPGCAYNGNTSVIVLDQSEGYSPPYPSYVVSFERPDALTVLFDVEISNSSSVPANAVALIDAAIIGAFAGADGGPRAKIGTPIFASRFYAPIAALGAWANIVTIKIGSENVSAAVFSGSIVGSALTVTSVASGAIAIGQTVVGPNVLPGTVITAGAGTSWTVSITHNVSATTLHGVLSTLDTITVRIDQAPVVAVQNIKVALV